MLAKAECVRGLVFATRAEANLALFEYTHGFCNFRRIQKRIGYLSPSNSRKSTTPTGRRPNQ
ncbi:IS3 family transposase [Streptomyces sp. NPDC048415]|uniref:IS3 family transposase n=1 Tax=Streptomyces sp. NPDC048415 TaxID=3154822 RepID=UPI00342622F2